MRFYDHEKWFISFSLDISLFIGCEIYIIAFPCVIFLSCYIDPFFTVQCLCCVLSDTLVIILDELDEYIFIDTVSRIVRFYYLGYE